MLKENKELHPRSRYREAEDNFKDDERFLAVVERRDREEIFDEYIHDWAKEVCFILCSVLKRDKNFLFIPH